MLVLMKHLLGKIHQILLENYHQLPQKNLGFSDGQTMQKPRFWHQFWIPNNTRFNRGFKIRKGYEKICFLTVQSPLSFTEVK